MAAVGPGGRVEWQRWCLPGGEVEWQWCSWVTCFALLLLLTFILFYLSSNLNVDKSILICLISQLYLIFL